MIHGGGPAPGICVLGECRSRHVRRRRVGARQAVACAQAIQHEVDCAFASSSTPIRVRIGIHTSDAIQEGDHFFGTTVHYAARVASHALAGEVLVSSLVRELVAAGASDFTFLGGREVELKGLDGAHQLYSLALT